MRDQVDGVSAGGGHGSAYLPHLLISWPAAVGVDDRDAHVRGTLLVGSVHEVRLPRLGTHGGDVHDDVNA